MCESFVHPRIQAFVHNVLHPHIYMYCVVPLFVDCQPFDTLPKEMPKSNGSDDSDDDRASILLLSMGNSSKVATELRTFAGKSNGVADAGGGGGRPKRSTHTPELQKFFQLNEGPVTEVAFGCILSS